MCMHLSPPCVCIFSISSEHTIRSDVYCNSRPQYRRVSEKHVTSRRSWLQPSWRHDAQTTPRSKTGVLSVTRRANLRGPLIRADELSITGASRTAASRTQTRVASKAPRRPYITGPSTVAPQHSDNADRGLEVFRDGARPSYL
jgi:hypothetical protein